MGRCVIGTSRCGASSKLLCSLIPPSHCLPSLSLLSKASWTYWNCLMTATICSPSWRSAPSSFLLGTSFRLSWQACPASCLILLSPQLMSWASSSLRCLLHLPRHMLHPTPFPAHGLPSSGSLTSVGICLGALCLQQGSPGSLASLAPPLTLKQYFLMTPLPASLLIHFLGSCQKSPAALISACPSFSVDSFQRISHPILPTHCLLGWRNSLFISPHQSCGADLSRSKLFCSGKSFPWDTRG